MSLDLSSSFLHFKIPMSEDSESGIYEFDQFKLDPDKLMLYRDDVGIPLPPKVVKTLSVLVENRGSILSKNELIDRVWDDSVVEESNLSQHLYLLRKTLGNRSDGQPYIETFRRRGYRFTGEVKRLNVDLKRPIGEPASAAPVSHTVERQGNVLRIVDWYKTPDVPAMSPEAVEEARTDSQRFLTPSRFAVGTAILLFVATAIVVFWYQSIPVASVNSAQPELSVARLTNGAVPIDATISPDGDDFVYHEIAGEVSQLWIQQVGQSGRIEIGRIMDQLYAAKTFSPDGRFVYYVVTDRSGRESALYRVPAMGGPHSKLLAGIYGPVSFSPDGNEMVFLRLQDGAKASSSIIIADKDGRQERLLLERSYPRRIVGPPSWSPDGNLIAFGEEDLEGGLLGATIRILGINPSDGSTQTVSNEKWDTVYRIVWTGDGNGLLTIATRANEGMTPRRDQIYYISRPDGASRRLTNEGNRHYLWGLGVTKHDAVIATPFSRSSQIWSVDLKDNGTAVQISSGNADGRAGLAQLPDGRIGYVARTAEAVNVWIMNPDGSDARQLTSDPPVVDEVRADPQGRYFVFLADVDGRSHIFRIDVDGQNLRQLTFGDKYDGDPSISPDGKSIIFGSIAVNEMPLRSELWQIFIDGGEPVRFSDENCGSPTISPDGAMVSCIRDGKEILVLSALDGKKIESYKLPASAVINFGAIWTLDGKGLTFIRAEKNVSNIWMQPRNEGPATRLTNFTSGYLTRYVFATDGPRLFVGRGFPVQDAILISNFR